jgi:hypothetical protein
MIGRAVPAPRKVKAMRDNGHALVRISVGRPTRRRLELLDLARRQADHLGPYGIRAKHGQSNRLYRKRGYLRLQFPTRRLARAYVERLERLREPAIAWRLIRRRIRTA